MYPREQEGSLTASRGNIDSAEIKIGAAVIMSGQSLGIREKDGFHLLALTDAAAVEKVRILIRQQHVPLTLLVKDVVMAKRITLVSAAEEQILQSSERPIVVLNKINHSALLAVSELESVGVRLPSTPLYELLFDYLDHPLVMTSCNITDDFIGVQQIRTLQSTQGQEIVDECDDSMVKIMGKTCFFIRRSRGFSKFPVALPISCVDTLALGTERNNVICTARNNHCFLSDPIRYAQQVDPVVQLRSVVDRLIEHITLHPKIIACDLHPSYNSTSLAKELSKKYSAQLVQVQHHKAHIASVAAEHNLQNYMGIAMDGLGFGEDGVIWGGEVFSVTQATNFTRIGSLEEQPQLGGDSATLHPKKMLFGILSKLMTSEELLHLNLFEEKESLVYLRQLKSGFNVPQTTSAGRILDAVAALLEICDERTYDGRPAMLLESVATTPLTLKPIIVEKERMILSTSALFKFLLDQKDRDRGVLAATAQQYLAEGLYTIAMKANKKNLPVVFSGGVAYNEMISEFMQRHGVLVNRDVPPGDGGICFGQAYLANAMNSS
jgi:hydrogenase maturation protein HypF